MKTRSKIGDIKKTDLYVINWANFLGKDFVKIIDGYEDFETVKPGHWLSSQEIEYLIKKEKKADANITDIDIFCLDRDMAQLFNSITGEEALINARLNFQDINYSGTAIFLVYGTNHWISCVVTKNSNDAPKFLFADSLGVNCNTYQHARTLMRLLTTLPNSSQNSGNSDNGRETSHSLDGPSLPLDLLLDRDSDERDTLFNSQIMASFFKDKNNLQKIDDNFLVYGPPKTGKFSLAYSISKLANSDFLAIDALSLIDPTMFNKKEDSGENRGNLGSQEQLIDHFLDGVAKDVPVVFFIHGLDMLISQADSETAKASLLNLFVNKIIKYKKNYKYILFIVSSNLDPFTQYPKGNNLHTSDFGIRPIKLDLPSYAKRYNIIKYYIENITLKSIKTYKNKSIQMTPSLLNALAKNTNKFNCLDIKNFIKIASYGMRDNRPLSKPL